MANHDSTIAALLTNPILMGIVNVTPDSFSDGGLFADAQGHLDPAAATRYALDLAQQGAAILDIGGEASSFFRPGVVPTPPAEQIDCVVPVIAAIARQRPTHPDTGLPVLISIDTRSADVARAAIEAGANIINDISAGQFDPHMFEIAAQYQVPIILMHFRDEAGQKPTPYPNVCAAVREYLQERIAVALAAGIPHHRIWLDPGIGFGKTPEDNWKLITHLPCLVALGHPIVLGISRKRFLTAPIGTTFMSMFEKSGATTTDLLGRAISSQNTATNYMAVAPGMASQTPSKTTLNDWPQRDRATAIITALAAAHGVKIHRVHNVIENRVALALARAAQPTGTTLCVS